jgi:predicted RNA-binding protein with TRAM domain
VQIIGNVKKGEFVNVKIEKVNEFELIGKPL